MSSTQGLHDIKALPQFYPTQWDIIIWAAISVLLLLAGIAVFKKLKNRKPDPVDTPTLSPIQAALFELDELWRKRLDPSVEPRALSSGISLIFRTYLENVVQIPAKDMTTKEIRKSLPESLMSEALGLNDTAAQQFTALVSDLLASLDMLTFSDKTSSSVFANAEDLERVFNTARSLLVDIDTLRMMRGKRPIGGVVDKRD